MSSRKLALAAFSLLLTFILTTISVTILASPASAWLLLKSTNIESALALAMLGFFVAVILHDAMSIFLKHRGYEDFKEVALRTGVEGAPGRLLSRKEKVIIYPFFLIFSLWFMTTIFREGNN